MFNSFPCSGCGSESKSWSYNSTCLAVYSEEETKQVLFCTKYLYQF